MSSTQGKCRLRMSFVTNEEMQTVFLNLFMICLIYNSFIDTFIYVFCYKLKACSMAYTQLHSLQRAWTKRLAFFARNYLIILTKTFCLIKKNQQRLLAMMYFDFAYHTEHDIFSVIYWKTSKLGIIYGPCYFFTLNYLSLFIHFYNLFYIWCSWYLFMSLWVLSFFVCF